MFESVACYHGNPIALASLRHETPVSEIVDSPRSHPSNSAENAKKPLRASVLAGLPTQPSVRFLEQLSEGGESLVQGWSQKKSRIP